MAGLSADRPSEIVLAALTTCDLVSQHGS